MTSTNRLDHIVHLTPVASVQETSEQFRKLGFTYVFSTVDWLDEYSLNQFLLVYSPEALTKMA